MAVGTISVTSREDREIGRASRKRLEIITVDLVGSSTDGTVPVLQVPMTGYLIKVITNPGTTAPTDNWDIILGDPEDAALDAAGSTLLNRHTTTSQQVYPLVSGAASPILLAGTYALTVSGTSVNSATARIIFYLVDSL